MVIRDVLTINVIDYVPDIHDPKTVTTPYVKPYDVQL
jgi:hypothetical protein